MKQDINPHGHAPTQQISAASATPARNKRQKQISLAWLEEPYNHTRGEMSLWIAVITQAMMDALSRANNAEANYNKNEAVHWLTGNSKDFIMVCLCAGFDPDYVRRKAKRTLVAPVSWRAEAGKGKRYLERKAYRRSKHKSCEAPESCEPRKRSRTGSTKKILRNRKNPANRKAIAQDQTLSSCAAATPLAGFKQDFMTLLSFPRRRGRPKVSRPDSDSGTPELVMKRLLGETAESLDLCLERGIITHRQHWCGIHLRWLYTLRYGAPGVRAVDPTHLGGMETSLDDPEWRSAREKEYHDAMKKLTDSGHALLLVNICIHNDRPKFLSLRKFVKLKSQQKLTDMIVNLRDGLDVLAKHWER